MRFFPYPNDDRKLNPINSVVIYGGLISWAPCLLDWGSDRGKVIRANTRRQAKHPGRTLRVDFLVSWFSARATSRPILFGV